MKKFYQFLLPLFVLLSVEAKSQAYTYHSFPDSNITWQGYLSCGVNIYEWTSSWTYSVAGDTTIDSYNYQKISSAGYTIGLVREDSSKRVYGFNLTGFDDDTTTLERPLYDFSLVPGDTMFSGKTYFVVDSVDTIYYYGIERKTLYTHDKEYSFLNDVWIEGIGSVQGPMAHWRTYYGLCHSSHLCLARQDTTTLARVTTFSGGCSYLNPVDEIAIRETIKISPNPAFSTFTLQLSSSPVTETYLLLYDALGREVKRELITTQLTTLNRNQLPAGIYYWQLQSGGVVAGRGKIVLE